MVFKFEEVFLKCNKNINDVNFWRFGYYGRYRLRIEMIFVLIIIIISIYRGFLMF